MELEILDNTIMVRKEKVYRSERKTKSGLSEDDMIIYVEIWKNQPKPPGTNRQFTAIDSNVVWIYKSQMLSSIPPMNKWKWKLKTQYYLH